jgi:hypothetical protein
MARREERSYRKQGHFRDKWSDPNLEREYESCILLLLLLLQQLMRVDFVLGLWHCRDYVEQRPQWPMPRPRPPAASVSARCNSEEDDNDVDDADAGDDDPCLSGAFLLQGKASSNNR